MMRVNKNENGVYSTKRSLGSQKGIAMLTVILFLSFMIIIAGLIMYVLTKGIQVTGSSRRYFSAFESAEAGIEWGMVRVEQITASGATLSGDTLTIDNRDIRIEVSSMFSAPVSGASIAFGSGYEGIGKGAAGGGSSRCYRITSDAIGAQQENVIVEIAYRKIIGIEAR